MNVLSFISANFVARQTGYRMTGGWEQGDATTNAWFRPLETFPERFDAMLAEVQADGYAHIDLWVAHLHFNWATPEHMAAAREALARRGLKVTSIAYHGTGEEELLKVCRQLRELDCDLISGGTDLLVNDRPRLVRILRGQGLRLAVENHPEKSAAELAARMGKGDEDVIGAAVDTGWFGTQGCDAAQAVHELKGRIFHLHLKDVKARRAEKTGFQLIDMGHETCALGAGIVPVEQCVKVAVRDGFTGPISFEHEPEEYDPNEDARAGLRQIESWL